MIDLYEKLKTITNEENILKDEPMSKHTTFRTGGNADFYVTPESINELEKILEITKNIVVLGNGSNVLVTDKGIRGIVVSLRKLNKYVIENDKIVADSGIPIVKLSHIAAENDLSGLEFACGIPGTLGGALYMNAGAYGSEMKDVVISTKYLDVNTLEIKTLNGNENEFAYRESIYSKNINGIILGAEIQLIHKNNEEIYEKMNENMQHRNSKQPVDKPSAGSTFKRQEGVIAAKLIDDAGLKGYRIGGAEVSTLHAGFIVNIDNATSKDILDLIEYVKKVVYEKYDVLLEPEVKIIGEL